MMTIHKIGSDLVRPFGLKGRGIPVGPLPSESDESERNERADRVDISPEGRELAARLLDEGREAAETRLRDIRARIDSGVYDDPSMAEEVARRLVDSGELRLVH